MARIQILPRVHAQGGPSNASRTTESRLQDPGWWPTKGDRSRDQYVGAKACAECHASEFETAQGTAMSHALTRSTSAQSLLQHNHLTFETGSFRYQITRRGGKEIQTVSKGASSDSAILQWAFGVGRMAQTYVFDRGERSFEGHVSFYTELQALDVTPGHPHGVPPNLGEAAGRLISSQEKRRCFGCHATASSTVNRFDPQSLVPGVSCEACHGPGAAHVAAAKAGNFELAAQSIVDPAKLNPVDAVEFCGACHRTWQDVVSDGPTRIGPLNIRFAPYRLENSRCWKNGAVANRITCVTCHDPHQPMAEDPAAYDAKCLQCHLPAGAPAGKPNMSAGDRQPGADHLSACTIGVKLCVTCHMPKFKSAGFHFTFTDHWIRIAPDGAPLPD